jgi:hypothetical protein
MPINKEVRTLLGISPSTWGLLLALIATLMGWGLSTQSTAKELDRKADKEIIEIKIDKIREDVNEIKNDLREYRKEIRDKK